MVRLLRGGDRRAGDHVRAESPPGVRARRVLVLDGDRADIGTHDSLLRRSALYRDLAGYWAGTARGGGTLAAMSPATHKTETDKTAAAN